MKIIQSGIFKRWFTNAANKNIHTFINMLCLPEKVVKYRQHASVSQFSFNKSYDNSEAKEVTGRRAGQQMSFLLKELKWINLQ